jgi:hypothetical protein
MIFLYSMNIDLYAAIFNGFQGNKINDFTKFVLFYIVSTYKIVYIYKRE